MEFPSFPYLTHSLKKWAVPYLEYQMQLNFSCLTRVRTKVSERTPNFDQKLPTYCCPLSLYSGGESAQLSLNFLKRLFLKKTHQVSIIFTHIFARLGRDGNPCDDNQNVWLISDSKTCTFDKIELQSRYFWLGPVLWKISVFIWFDFSQNFYRILSGDS